MATRNTPTLQEYVIPTPKQIVDYLDTVIIGQQETKKKVAIEVYKHLLKIKNMDKLDEQDEDISKSNILITGLTGTGKTLMAQALANFLDVPLFIQDSTNLTEAGYVGEDVENCIKGLLRNADYNVALAERGIIVLDEIDKLNKKGENMSTTADVGHEGVQQAMLTMLEGTIVSVPEGKRRHPEEKGTQVDTSNILFIGIGSFDGIEEIVKNRLDKKDSGSTMGFGANVRSKNEEHELKEIRRNITREDLIKFGMLGEVLGRFAILCNNDPLDKEDLISILKLKKNIFHEFKIMFELMGKHLIVDDEILEYIAERAIKERTGARGIKSIVEDIMSELMFVAPSETRKKNYVLDRRLLEQYKLI